MARTKKPTQRPVIPAVEPFPKYAATPIQEATCEFRFEPGKPWNGAITGILYTSLKSEFPIIETVRDISASLNVSDEFIRQDVTPIDRTHFIREDRSALISISPNVLSVTHLAPYPGWEALRPVIVKAFKAFRRTVQPDSIRRVGLRYVNRVVIPGDQVNLEEYFDFYPHIGEAMPQLQVDFLTAVLFPFEDARDMLSVSLRGVTTGESHQRTMLLDLDYYLLVPGSLDFPAVEPWLDTGHNSIRTVFEGTIKQPLRDLFTEGPLR